jgi:hypothetical protein
MVAASEIPVAHTPPGGYGERMPPPILGACTEPIAPGLPDLRGLWQAYAVETNGVRTAGTAHLERIEQAGYRVVITAGGVVHDMVADGTLEHGVHDVSGFTGAPVHVAAAFEDGRLVLRPNGGPVAVTRELDGDELVWHLLPLARVTRMRPVATA